MNAQFLFDRQQEADEKEYKATKTAFLRLGPYLFNEVAGKMEPHQRAKPKPKPALATANLFATPRKLPAVATKTPKRGRPWKNPVALATVPVPVPEPEQEPELNPILTRIGRKVKVPVYYRC